MTSRARLSLWILALLGLGAATASSVVHYRLLTEVGYTSACDVSSTFSCTTAYQSAYGALFGVPVALLGVLWFVGLIGLLVVERTGTSDARANAPGYIFAMATIGLAFVLYLAFGAFFVLKTICLLCLLTYISVVGIFLVAGSATTYPMTTLPSRLLRDIRTAVGKPLVLAIVALLVVGAVSAIAFFPRRYVAPAVTAAGVAPAAGSESGASQDSRSEVERWFDSQPRAIVPVDPAGAAVLIVKFNDYQCPPCRQTYKQYKPILAKYAQEAPGKVRFVTKDFPLDPKCNGNAPQGVRIAACDAAVAVRLAAKNGKAEQVETFIFANQPSLTPQLVRDAARNIGGVSDFEARYNETLELVRADTALGGLLGVRATPTFFINGVKIDGGMQPQFFDAIIAYQLKKAQE